MPDGSHITDLEYIDEEEPSVISQFLPPLTFPVEDLDPSAAVIKFSSRPLEEDTESYRELDIRVPPGLHGLRLPSWQEFNNHTEALLVFDDLGESSASSLGLRVDLRPRDRQCKFWTVVQAQLMNARMS
ncbi:unnamed protein product [Protopolystoma xenopodis]|uniref:Uncharacterized protein n=1 Tax=Protopolystoma xenopodis TaxID=117903 RepID=A0A448X2P0_9PLAT|nr:unnamed protein product [Protopolystoma xenopodis]